MLRWLERWEDRGVTWLGASTGHSVRSACLSIGARGSLVPPTGQNSQAVYRVIPIKRVHTN